MAIKLFFRAAAIAVHGLRRHILRAQSTSSTTASFQLWRRPSIRFSSAILPRFWRSCYTTGTKSGVDSGDKKKEVGQIQLIIGPMFSGKTTEMFRRIRRYTVANRRCLVIKYKKDLRYSGEEAAATHDSQTFQAIPCMRLSEVSSIATRYDVIGIDEGQFFPDLVDFCEALANQGKTVIVSALDGTYQRKPFEQVVQLVPLSEQVQKLSAVCMKCFRVGAFSKRISSETEVEVIGGKDKYIAVCRSCYHAATHRANGPSEQQDPLGDADV